MLMDGFLPLTLQDYPGRIAAICFTVGCPLRCPYCHNPDLVLPSQNPRPDRTEDFLAYLEKRHTFLGGVVLSGGEPLLHADAAVLIRKIKERGLQVKLDTNGLYPDRLQTILDRGLPDFVALDYKNCRARWSETVGLPPSPQTDALYSLWRESLKILRRSGVSYELRTTVVRELHRQTDLVQMAHQLHEEEAPAAEPWFLQSFQDGPNLIRCITKTASPYSAYTPSEMSALQTQLRQIVPGTMLRDTPF